MLSAHDRVTSLEHACPHCSQVEKRELMRTSTNNWLTRASTRIARASVHARSFMPSTGGEGMSSIQAAVRRCNSRGRSCTCQCRKQASCASPAGHSSAPSASCPDQSSVPMPAGPQECDDGCNSSTGATPATELDGGIAGSSTQSREAQRHVTLHGPLAA